MKEALFITQKELKSFTSLNGNVDPDKFMQYIKIAQDIHIQQFLGTKLFDRISNDILANNLTNPYKDLLEKYVQPMVIHWAMVEYLPFAAYTIANKGVYKHQSENSQTVDKGEVDFLVEKERYTAQNYTRRFIDYMCNNSSLFPEYLTNSSGDVYPAKESYFTGWVL
jgi:hypothetical protein